MSARLRFLFWKVRWRLLVCWWCAIRLVQSLRRNERGLETVEWAIVAGLIVTGAVVLAVAVIRAWIHLQIRLLGGNATYSGGGP